MQGRLVPPEDGRFQSFPRERWRDEFSRAADAGLDAIEWIFDEFGESVNPIASDSGIAEINALSVRTNVKILSVCADYFMDHPFVSAGPTEFSRLVERFFWLLERSALLGIQRIVIPFVDASRIVTLGQRQRIVAMLKELSPAAERSNIELHLETDLAPSDFAALLRQIENPSVKVNYDSGNSAALGYSPVAEFAAYGRRVGSVHIKDRKLGGGTVPLGSGDADLPALALCLYDVGYAGDFVLQAARGADGAEVSLAAQNHHYLLQLLEDARTARAPLR
jgi:hexulose-6-phosphate isomerase